jgi:hypothetical protein
VLALPPSKQIGVIRQAGRVVRGNQVGRPVVRGDQVGRRPLTGLAPPPSKWLGAIRQARRVVRGDQAEWLGVIRPAVRGDQVSRQAVRGNQVSRQSLAGLAQPPSKERGRPRPAKPLHPSLSPAEEGHWWQGRGRAVLHRWPAVAVAGVGPDACSPGKESPDRP